VPSIAVRIDVFRQGSNTTDNRKQHRDGQRRRMMPYVLRIAKA
jgi:hypothetical protein